LDGRNRFQLTQAKPFGIFRTSRTARNYLTRLYGNPQDQTKLREIVYKEFGWFTYLKKYSESTGDYIDITLSNVPINEKNGSTKEDSIKSLKGITPLSVFGDGIKCFIGICLSVLSYPFRIVLLDEPEAFLHPPIAYSLGKNLSQWAKEKHRSLIISTHSADILMGCLQSIPSSEISIIRLTYQNNISTVKELESNEISNYADNPLLRSSDVLNAFFHNSAIVTEGAKDKVIYQSTNNKLLQHKRGTNNTVFLIANGKQNIPRIVRSLREIGVPAVGIYDFDALKEQSMHGKDKTLWKSILSSSNIECSKFEYLEQERQYIEFTLKKLNADKEKDEQDYFENLPIGKLPDQLIERIHKLLNELREYGIFIVPIGKLEQWLKKSYSGPEGFLVEMLNEIVRTPEPSNNNIWQFIDDINTWISNSNRKGMNT
jgi:predicted ATP-dependent endonuclease of OLD family